MTTTINCQSCSSCSDSSLDDCSIAQSAVVPDCFKLRIGYDPTGPTYELSLCSLVTVFTNPCCISGAGSLILRIPLTFAQDCSLYRVNVNGETQIAAVFGDSNISTGEAIPLEYFVDGGFLNIVIPAAAITFSQNGNGQCVATITFAGLAVPLLKLPNYCYCPALCNTVNWVIGSAPVTTTSTTLPP
jgi:hypothetical protein